MFAAGWFPELLLSLLLLLQSQHLFLQTPEGKDVERTSKEEAADGRVEDGWFDEGEAIGRPVVEVGRLRQVPDSDPQADQSDGIRGREGVVLVAMPQKTPPHRGRRSSTNPFGRSPLLGD